MFDSRECPRWVSVTLAGSSSETPRALTTMASVGCRRRRRPAPKLLAMMRKDQRLAVGGVAHSPTDRPHVRHRAGLRARVAFRRRSLHTIGQRAVPAGDRQRRLERPAQPLVAVTCVEDRHERFRRDEVVARESGAVRADAASPAATPHDASVDWTASAPASTVAGGSAPPSVFRQRLGVQVLAQLHHRRRQRRQRRRRARSAGASPSSALGGSASVVDVDGGAADVDAVGDQRVAKLR